MARSARVPTQRPSIPLGSLTQVSARELTPCDACGSTRVTRIAMSLTDGSPVMFASCHACEHRSWQDRSGGVLPVSAVLDKARKQ